MDITQQDLTLEESLAQVMQTLPPVIYDYVVQERYISIVQNLMKKYNLRIDQGGVLERETLLLLMGVENPNEFTQALADEAHLNEETIGSIVKDVNDQIFIPLRKEEESGGTMGAPVTQSRTTSPLPRVDISRQSMRPVMPPVPPTPVVPRVEPTIQPQRLPQEGQGVPTPTPHTDNEHIASLPPRTMMPRPFVNPQGAVPQTPSSGSLNVLERREVPPSAAPTNLPGMMPGATPPETLEFKVVDLHPKPAPQPAVQRVAPPAGTQQQAGSPPPATYASDPYREPIDEPLSEM